MRLFFFSIVLFFNVGCVAQPVVSDSQKAVQLKIHWQFVGELDGKAERIDVIDSIYVVNRKDHFIYLIPHETEHTKIIVNRDNEIIKDSFLGKTIHYEAFVFRDKDSFGLKFDSLSANAGTTFNVDSFLVNKAFKGMKSYNEENDSLIEMGSFENDKRFVEKYIPKILVENAFDSTYFFFTNEKIETTITFSELLEQKKGMKLYQIIGVYNEIPVGKFPYTIPKRKMIWELKNVNLPLKENIDLLMNEHYKMRTKEN